MNSSPNFRDKGQKGTSHDDQTSHSFVRNLTNPILNLVIKSTDAIGRWFCRVAVSCQARFLVRANPNKFVELTPVANADGNRVYNDALKYALESPDVFNIAVTGPFGAGKSSVIRTFQARNPGYRFLNISLAAFDEPQGNTEANQEHKSSESKPDQNLLEKSILQQMLYGEDANKLPYSRFRRIETPKHSIFKAGLIVFWCVVATTVWFLWPVSWRVLSTYHITPLIAGIFLAGPIVLLADLYRATFRLSLKKVSLKNAELEVGDLPGESIFNRHLDEIIYFFQTSQYDVVVIEDLDRFGSPSIFVKLRELNNLINKNAGTKGRTRFLYAILDDMFALERRTKFFDFVIPVIPVISFSNSFEKMSQRANALQLKRPIARELLTLVSLYINDFRLIHNIFNEFILYDRQLRTDNLDPSKLFAIIVYKNYYPGDFEDLHHGKGALFQVCSNRITLIEAERKHLNTEIDALREQISQSDAEHSQTIGELRSIYLWELVQNAGHAVEGVVMNGKDYPLKTLLSDENFRSLQAQGGITISARSPYYGNPIQHFPINKSFDSIENQVDSTRTYKVRLQAIANRATSARRKLLGEIAKLERKIADLPLQSLSALIDGESVSIDLQKLPNSELLLALLRDGYIDENYFHYSSSFYEGTKTRRDYDFLLAIRNRSTPDPSAVIDTAHEVCAEMQAEDFRRPYVLNISLFDYLLEDVSSNRERLNAAKMFMEQHQDVATEFLALYGRTGKRRKELMQWVCGVWEDFSSAAIASPYTVELIANLLIHADESEILSTQNSAGVLTSFLSSRIGEVFISNFITPTEFSVLKGINVRVNDVESISLKDELYIYCVDHGLFEINARNLKHIVATLGSLQNIDVRAESANFTSVRLLNNSGLTRVVTSNLSEYVDNVLLALPDNVGEDGDTILYLLSSNELTEEQWENVASKQKYVFDSFDGIPESMWDFMISNGKVKVGWRALHECIVSEQVTPETCVALLSEGSTLDGLMTTSAGLNALEYEEYETIANFVIENDSIPDSSYSKVVTLLEWEVDDFPSNLSVSKRIALARAKIVKLSAKSFSSARGETELLSILIEESIKEYLEHKDDFPIHDSVRNRLLTGKLAEEQKVQVCYGVTAQEVERKSALARSAADVLSRNDFEVENFEQGVLALVIESASSSETSIAILLPAMKTWSEQSVMKILRRLPEPYSKIAEYGKKPKIPRSDQNLQLAESLVAHDLISSHRIKGEEIQLFTKRSEETGSVQLS
ncbi:MAG: hypothetical protein KDK99_22455 [Verrucomicrobiales bacterium]|nr:hypothetical protein [Verrucomicrobiales bacterium]